VQPAPGDGASASKPDGLAKRSVYVLRGSAPEAASVTTGLSDGTVTEEFFREAPHDYAMHLSMLTTVDSARIEISLPGQPAWYEYRDGARAAQAR